MLWGSQGGVKSQVKRYRDVHFCRDFMASDCFHFHSHLQGGRVATGHVPVVRNLQELATLCCCYQFIPAVCGEEELPINHSQT